MLFHDRMRVCIHSANYIPLDFEMKEQSFWVGEFPIKSRGQRLGGHEGVGIKRENEKFESRFGADLIAYLQAYLDGCMQSTEHSMQRRFPNGMHEAIMTRITALANALDGYDFTSACDVHLVASVPGSHGDQRYGLARVSRLLQMHPREEDGVRQWCKLCASLPRNARGPTRLGCNVSSIGSMKKEQVFLDEFAVAFECPDLDHVDIYWPSKTCVYNSAGGPSCGNSICCSAPNIFADIHTHRLHPQFARCLRKWESVDSSDRTVYGWSEECGRPVPASPHIKTFFERCSHNRARFLLSGSHNLSMSAWGSVTKKSQRLWIRSWELGVMCVHGGGPDMLLEDYLPYKLNTDLFSKGVPYEEANQAWAQLPFRN